VKLVFTITNRCNLPTVNNNYIDLRARGLSCSKTWKNRPKALLAIGLLGCRFCVGQTRDWNWYSGKTVSVKDVLTKTFFSEAPEIWYA